MSTLNLDWFPKQVPPKPTGHYAHIITVRVTDSYPLFQTDGELNTARVAAGIASTEPMTRITIFKRKQSTPERLVGRELLRHYGFTSRDVSDGKADTGSDGLPICDYNVKFCTRCPDCIAYGFAIGDSGSEKSKVVTDTAFSLTSYEHSHEAFTLNAPYEDGTMTRFGEVTSRINEQDHVTPQVIFPSVVTTRDLTANLFLYAVNNVLRTRRYGAQTTRTGRMRNHVVAIVLADGEIFSNLLFTQTLFDALKERIAPPDPVNPQDVIAAAGELLPALLRQDGVKTAQVLTDKALADFLGEVADMDVKELLQKAYGDSAAYHAAWIARAGRTK